MEANVERSESSKDLEQSSDVTVLSGSSWPEAKKERVRECNRDNDEWRNEEKSTCLESSWWC